MNKLKLTMLAATAALALSGCQTLDASKLHTNASPQTIAEAKKDLSGIDDLKVLDNGVIYYYIKKPSEANWDRVWVNAASYRIACKYLKVFVDRGMTVRMYYQGEAAHDYNAERCQTEVPTNYLANVK